MKFNYSLDDMRCFCAVAQCQSFKQAAAMLCMPLSTLSRRVHKLEQDLQLRLLNRDAHRVSLTQTGLQYYERCHHLFDELSTIGEELHRDKHQPRGKIRVTMPSGAGPYFLGPVLNQFLRTYPEIQMEIAVSNTVIDLDAQQIDIAFRMGHPRKDNWIARKLKDCYLILCADQPMPSFQHPTDLYAHQIVSFHPMRTWYFESPHHPSPVEIHPQRCKNQLLIDDMGMLQVAVSQGLGIGFLPDYFVAPALERREIYHLLPDWHSENRTLFIMYRERSNLPLRVRLLIEFVIAHFD